MESEKATKKSKLRVWLERFGIGAFLFFLIKGIVWLFIFWLGWKSCS